MNYVIEAGLRSKLSAQQVRIAELETQLVAAQAHIDALMLEHCPEDMTDEQRERWARHQRPVSKEEAAEINAILMKDAP
jgi:hypothetical protein